MDSLGFEETFSLQEFVVTGTQVRIFKAYPFGRRIFALSEVSTFLIDSAVRL